METSRPEETRPAGWAALAAVCVLVAYLPAAGLDLFGDDFEWLDASYPAFRRPYLLLAPILNFVRPLVKLSYLACYVVAGTAPLLYVALNVGLHVTNVFVLALLVARIARSARLGAATALLWGLSSIHDEVPLSSACRPDSTHVLFLLLVLLRVASPRPLGRRGLAGCLLLAVAAALTKEAWVVLPALVAVAVWASSWARLSATGRAAGADAPTADSAAPSIRAHALRTALPFALLVGLYVTLALGLPRLAHTPSPLGYATADLAHMAQKTAYIPLKYLGLGEHYGGSWWEIAAVGACALAAFVVLVRLRLRLALLGLVWMAVTIAPSVPIRYLPSRYHYAPLAGFWIAVVAVVTAALPAAAARARVRPLVLGLPLAFAALVHIAQQSGLVALDIGDIARYSAIHRDLVRLFESVQGGIVPGQPFLFVNAGTRRVRDEAARDLRGNRKLLYAREDSLWQLIEIAPLIEFADHPLDFVVKPVTEETLAALPSPPRVLVFDDRGFRWQSPGSRGAVDGEAAAMAAGTSGRRRQGLVLVPRT